MTSILKADNIQDADGNNIINESGNTITIGASGDTTNVIGTLQTDGAAVANTPYFYARKTSTQTLTNGADVKVTFDTEDFDTGSEYATGTSRFVPANGNTYKIHAQINAKGSSNTVLQEARIILFKNGSEVFQMRNDTYTNNANWMAPSISKFVTGNGSDYYEIYANVYVGSGDAQIRSGAYFSAFKLIT